MTKLRFLTAMIYFDSKRFFSKIAEKSLDLLVFFRLSSRDNLREIVKNFYKNGYVVIPNYWPVEKCRSLVVELDQLFGNPSISNSLKDDVRIYDAQNHSAIAAEFFSDIQLRQISKWATGLKLENYGAMANRVEPSKSNFGSGGGWHRDSNYSQFKTLIYLTDVTEADDGAFQIIPKTTGAFYVLNSNFRAGKKLTDTRWTDPEIGELGVGGKICTVIGGAGSLVIFDTSNLHRGAPNRNKSRYALTNYYYSNLTHQQYGQKVENAK